MAREWLAQASDPTRLIMVARSNRSAAALRERVEQQLPGAQGAPLVLTHEALARRALRLAGHPAALQLELDRAGEWLAMRTALREAAPLLSRLGPLAEEPSCILDSLNFVSVVKQAMIGPGLLAERLREAPAAVAETAVVFATYQRILDRASAHDLRDLPLLALERLWDDRQLLSGWSDLILVDEAEDLSSSQWYLLRELADRLSRPGLLVMAGDWRESIPSYLGPSSRPFEESFPNELHPAEWQLKDDAPGWLVGLLAGAGGERRLPVWAALPGAGAAARASIWVAPDETEEAFAAARQLAAWRLEDGVAPEETAVIVRGRGQMAVIADALTACSLPYSVERAPLRREPAVAVLIGWLEFLCNPSDDRRLERLLGIGPEAIPAAGIRALRTEGARAGGGLAPQFWRLGTGARSEGDEAESWRVIATKLSCELASLGGGRPGLGLEVFAEAEFFNLWGSLELLTGLAAMAVSDPHLGATLGRIESAVASLSPVDQRLGHGARTLTDWLSLVRMAISTTQASAVDGGGGVALVTVEQAKGRSWRRVLVCGCAAGLFPMSSPRGGLLNQAELAGLQEVVVELEQAFRGPERTSELEERAFLVAASRAREELICIWPRRYRGREMERSPLLGTLLAEGVRELPIPSPVGVTTADIEERLALHTPAELLNLTEGPLRARALEIGRLVAAPDPTEGGAVRLSRPFQVSATSMKDWLACPRKFFFATLRPGREDALELRAGQAMHSLLERLYQRGSEWQDQLPRFRQVAEEIIAYELMPEVRATVTRAVDQLFLEHQLRQLAASWAEGIVAPGRDVAGGPLAEEVRFSYGESSAWTMTGKVDALWRHPDGTIELLDYKTGSPDSLSALREAVVGPAPKGPRDWQLPIYQLAAQHGCFSAICGEAVPQLLRNWYVAHPSRRRAPFPRVGFRTAELSTGGLAEDVLDRQQLERIDAELHRQLEAMLEGYFPAAPRHPERTCLAGSPERGCPMQRCCDGAASVGKRPIPEVVV